MKILYVGSFNKEKKQIEVGEVYVTDSNRYIPKNLLSSKEDAAAFVTANHAKTLEENILNAKHKIGDLEKQLEWEKEELRELEEELEDFKQYLSDTIEKLLEDPADETKNV